MRFYGDFFGNGELSELESTMAGLPLEPELEDALGRLDVDYYMNGITASDLYELLDVFTYKENNKWNDIPDMRLTTEHLGMIEQYMLTPRKPPKDTLSFLNAVLYVVENGGKWRALPSEFGNWHTAYVRFNRWSKNGTLLAVFTGLQQREL